MRSGSSRLASNVGDAIDGTFRLHPHLQQVMLTQVLVGEAVCSQAPWKGPCEKVWWRHCEPALRLTALLRPALLPVTVVRELPTAVPFPVAPVRARDCAPLEWNIVPLRFRPFNELPRDRDEFLRCVMS